MSVMIWSEWDQIPLLVLQLLFFATEEVDAFAWRQGYISFFVGAFGTADDGCFAAACFRFTWHYRCVYPFHAYVEHFFNRSADLQFIGVLVYHESIRIALVGEFGRFFRDNGLDQDLLSHFLYN